jgi:hypothetical protein
MVATPVGVHASPRRSSASPAFGVTRGGRGGTGPEAVGVPHHGWSQGGGRRAGHDLRQCGEPAPVVRDQHGVGGGQGVTGGRRPPPGQGHGLASAVDPRERLAPRPQAQLDRRRSVEAQVDHFDAGVRRQAGQPVSVAIGRQGRHQRHAGAGGRGQRRRQGRPAGAHVLDGGINHRGGSVAADAADLPLPVDVEQGVADEANVRSRHGRRLAPAVGAIPILRRAVGTG